jgi:hypothetical protein
MIRPSEPAIWQVMTIGGRYNVPALQSWHETKEEAVKTRDECERFWPDHEFWLEQGTGEIHDKCRGCGTVYASERHDAYGIHTGYYCDDCYENHYPYRKDKYFDPSYAGERLEED